MAEARERILEAALACVGRSGLGRTTIEDVAQAAGLSRATVYRHFPGGRDQLVADLIAWEVANFFARLADAVAGAQGPHELLEETLLFAHRAIQQHDVLQKILRTEPERLVPQLSVESSRLLPFISAYLGQHLPADRADYVARMVLSFIASPGRWDLTDRQQVRELVRTELLAGV